MEAEKLFISVVDSPAKADHVLVVDVSNLAYRSAYAYEELATADGRRSGHVYGAVRLLMATLRNDLAAGKWCFVFCYDGPKAREHRQATLPSYKANREDGRFNPVPEVKAVLYNLPGLHLEVEGREGDDAICWIVDKLQGSTAVSTKRAEDRQVVVYTGDRDLWALTRYSNTRIFSPNLKRYVEPADIKKAYHVNDPARIHVSKAVFGDESDNVKGVRGLRKALVEPVLNAEDINNIDDFYNALPEHKSRFGTTKSYKDLLLDEDRVRRNYSVVKPDTTGFGMNQVRWTPSVDAGRAGLVSHLRSYQCNSLPDHVGLFYGDELELKAEYVKV